MLKIVFAFLITTILSSSAFAQFTSEDELTFITSGGNTNNKTYEFATRNSYKWPKNKFTLNGSYSRGESDGVLDDDNWTALLRFDHDLNSRLDIFVADFFESDQFKGFWARNNIDIGLQYKLVDKEKLKVLIEAGYRYTRENFVQDEPDNHEHKLRFYSEVSYIYTKGIEAKYWVEYIPSLENSENYIVKMEPSLLTLINKTFTLKSAVLWEYENEPVEGRDQHDYKTTLSLIAKF